MVLPFQAMAHHGRYMSVLRMSLLNSSEVSFFGVERGLNESEAPPARQKESSGIINVTSTAAHLPWGSDCSTRVNLNLLLTAILRFVLRR